LPNQECARRNARVALAAAQLGPDTIYVGDDELKMHAVEVFDVERPWDNFVSRPPRPQTRKVNTR
jgi:hypothetical protein